MTAVSSVLCCRPLQTSVSYELCCLLKDKDWSNIIQDHLYYRY